MNGKGSTRRPAQVSEQQVSKNWARTFKRKHDRYVTRVVDGKKYYLATVGGVGPDDEAFT